MVGCVLEGKVCGRVNCVQEGDILSKALLECVGGECVMCKS